MTYINRIYEILKKTPKGKQLKEIFELLAKDMKDNEKDINSLKSIIYFDLISDGRFFYDGTNWILAEYEPYDKRMKTLRKITQSFKSSEIDELEDEKIEEDETLKDLELEDDQNDNLDLNSVELSKLTDTDDIDNTTTLED